MLSRKGCAGGDDNLDCIDLVLGGVTTVEELIRNTLTVD